MFRRFFITTKSNIQKKKDNQQKGSSNVSTIRKINNVHFSSISSIFTVANKHTIPKIISFVKVTKVVREDKPTKLGVINATPNHPAERLIKSPAYARSQGLVKNLFIKNYSSTSEGGWQ